MVQPSKENLSLDDVRKKAYGSLSDDIAKELDEENPNIFQDTDGLDFEAIADSNPDVAKNGMKIFLYRFI